MTPPAATKGCRLVVNCASYVGESAGKINACYAYSKPQAASWFRKRGSHEGVYGN